MQPFSAHPAGQKRERIALRCPSFRHWKLRPSFVRPRTNLVTPGVCSDYGNLEADAEVMYGRCPKASARTDVRLGESAQDIREDGRLLAAVASLIELSWLENAGRHTISHHPSLGCVCVLGAHTLTRAHILPNCRATEWEKRREKNAGNKPFSTPAGLKIACGRGFSKQRQQQGGCS